MSEIIVKLEKAPDLVANIQKAPDLLIEFSQKQGPAGSAGLVWQGDFSDVTSYKRKDVVFFSGSAYVCLGDSSGDNPENSDLWQILAKKGNDGADGADGITPVKGVDYFDGNDGREVEVRNNSVFIQWRHVGDEDWSDLIPVSSLKGDPGIQGVQGEKGEQGEKGDKGDQGIQGEKGDKGDKGDQGIQGVQGLNGADGADGKSGFVLPQFNERTIIYNPDNTVNQKLYKLGGVTVAIITYNYSGGILISKILS